MYQESQNDFTLTNNLGSDMKSSIFHGQPTSLKQINSKDYLCNIKAKRIRGYRYHNYNKKRLQFDQ